MAGEYTQGNQMPQQAHAAQADAALTREQYQMQQAYERQQLYAQQMAEQQAQYTQQAQHTQQAQQMAEQQAQYTQQAQYAAQSQPPRADFGQYVPTQDDYAYEQALGAAQQPQPGSPIYTAENAYQGAYAQHAGEPKGGALRSFLSFLLMLAIVLACAWLLRTFVIAPYEIPSGSMENTIMISDKVFSEKVSYYLHDVEPGDIVTFDDPEVPDRTLIKRCIAVGGQTVDIRDGALYIDGQLQQESYVGGRETVELEPAEGVAISYPYTVPAGYLWVMGDNRTNSADSRYFGAVPASSVSGHAICIYWPLDRIGGLN